MTPTQATVKQIRSILFNSNHYAVIGEYEYTNSEARRTLYDMENQEATANYAIDNGCLYVWGL